jgi:Ser-tRNA(Ala) deacylase AlaX
LATRLLYLEAFDATTASAKVVAIREAEDGQLIVELDQTCFYPRGGGQDWDIGKIQAPKGLFSVTMVRLNELGTVQHFGTLTDGALHEGDTVECSVDSRRRNINTRLHSAGHLIDMAVTRLKLSWMPGRGAHYPHMSFVEFETGDFVADNTVQGSVQREVDALVSSGDYVNKILFIPVSKMGQYCHHVPENIPTNKPARLVLYADDFGIPCGGTHVQLVRDIGKIDVTKVKSKKGITRVNYRVEGIN